MNTADVAIRLLLKRGVRSTNAPSGLPRIRKIIIPDCTQEAKRNCVHVLLHVNICRTQMTNHAFVLLSVRIGPSIMLACVQALGWRENVNAYFELNEVFKVEVKCAQSCETSNNHYDG